MAVAPDDLGTEQCRICDPHKNVKLVAYEGAPHGMSSTLKDQVNADLLDFFGKGN